MEKQAKLFIVEDDDDDRVILSIELKEYGIKNFTRFFSNINDLLAFCESNKHFSSPLLILLDVFIEGPDVEEAVKTIRSVEDLSQVPIVIMLGGKSEKEYFKSKNLDVDGYMTKPVDGQLLKRYIGILD